MGVSPNELTTQHFLIPVMNMFALLKEFMYGVLDYTHVAMAVLSTLTAVVIVFTIANVMFKKDKWVLGK